MTPLTSATEIDIRAAFRNLCGSGVPEEHLADMLATHAIGLLENQRPEWFGDVPRTPETVLRAMLAAYTDAAVAAEVPMLRAEAPTMRQQGDYFNAKDAAGNMRSALAQFLADGEIVPWLTLHTDYEARLAGATPLDAPPAKN